MVFQCRMAVRNVGRRRPRGRNPIVYGASVR